MKWLDKLANKLADMFACPPAFTQPQTVPAVTPPAGIVFTEQEVAELQEEIEKLHNEYDDLLHIANELRKVGKFRKKDKELLDQLDKHMNHWNDW